MNNVNMANTGMGGSVGGPVPMMNNAAIAQGGAAKNAQANSDTRVTLNTYIYEYFLRSGMYDCARAILASEQVKVKQESPGGRRDENGNLLNGISDDAMDTESKDDMDKKRPEDLPAPNVPQAYPESCFLFEWFSLFWDMMAAQKGQQLNSKIGAYVQHAQSQSRRLQYEQQTLLRNLRPGGPDGFHPQSHSQANFQQMMRMQNGAMNMNMKHMNPGITNLQRTAMANNSNPQALQMLQNKSQMRDLSMSGVEQMRDVRPASPGIIDNAPSPSKRPRLDGPPFQQGPVMINGRTAGVIPIQNMGFHNPYVSAQSKTNIANYAATLQQHHGNQMPNKSMSNISGHPVQGSPMVQQGGLDGNGNIAPFYNSDMAGGIRPPQPNGNQQGGSNHALQDYQMQLMLLEQQNKKRLMMARQEQDVGGNGMARSDGPLGVGHGGPLGGPSAQIFQQGTSPTNRPGSSPNPSEQMKRASQQMGNVVNLGSPLPEHMQQNRSSPNPVNFMTGGQMSPDVVPQMFNGVKNAMELTLAGQINGGMRPPGSHHNAPFTGQMNQQMVARQQQQMGQIGCSPMPQWPGPNGNQIGAPQGSQSQSGTPLQRAMAPPAAPAVTAAPNGPNSRNTTSSPQVSTAAPSTPSQANKPAPKKKDAKNAKNKKKSNTNLNSGTTPAADSNPDPEPPTPATPITPVAPQSFSKQGSNAGAAPPGISNGQPVVPASTAAAPVPPPSHQIQQDSGFGLDSLPMEVSIDPFDTITNADAMNDFDFDSFLHDGVDNDGGTFDFTGGSFIGDNEISAE